LTHSLSPLILSLSCGPSRRYCDIFWPFPSSHFFPFSGDKSRYLAPSLPLSFVPFLRAISPVTIGVGMLGSGVADGLTGTANLLVSDSLVFILPSSLPPPLPFPLPPSLPPLPSLLPFLLRAKHVDDRDRMHARNLHPPYLPFFLHSLTGKRSKRRR